MWNQTLSKFYLLIIIIIIKALIRLIFFVFLREKDLRYGALKENDVKERLNSLLLFRTFDRPDFPVFSSKRQENKEKPTSENTSEEVTTNGCKMRKVEFRNEEKLNETLKEIMTLCWPLWFFKRSPLVLVVRGKRVLKDFIDIFWEFYFPFRAFHQP